ncbi:contact-dependent growth inhibition system immunity protein [Methylobacterium brachiatum]|uniref:contact-dependent growth inhibition system immunity protein n=1 Tax=Methylobacterium brachiatum TaxID=269660 RepID=UPI000B89E050|nr:contact-dependent growth inhibition system immunity protein [Methylobacterium brachiatum]
MSEQVIRGYWAHAWHNKDFILIQTYSGYRGGTNGDFKGKTNYLEPDATDEVLGSAVQDAMAHSRWVLPAPREGTTYPEGVEFDADLGDWKISKERFELFVKNVMRKYRYKTKGTLFQDMKNCSIEKKNGQIKFMPMHHEKFDRWSRTKGDGIEDFIIPDTSTNAEIGAALRTAFSRCTG